MGAQIILSRPSDGPVTQRYGATQLQDGKPHAGQDYAYTDGVTIFDDVWSADDGVVLWAGDSRLLGWPNPWYINPDFDRTDQVDTSAGNLVVTGHWYGVMQYAHLESIDVVKGQAVHRGQRLGTVGDTGYTAGKHLHWALMLYLNTQAQTFHFTDPYWGCSDPNPYMEDNDDMFNDEDRKLLRAVKEAIIDGGTSMLYGASIQNLIDDVPRRTANAVAGYPIKRDGKTVSWLQDSADGTSLAWSLQRQVLPAMAETLKIDPAALRDAFEQAVAGTSVTIAIGGTEGKAV